MSEPVVISGVGTLGSFGAGVEALRAALADCSPAVSEVDRSGGFHRDQGARLAASARDIDLSAWIPRAKARRMSGPSKLAVAAARMARSSEASLQPPLLGRRCVGDGELDRLDVRRPGRRLP